MPASCKSSKSSSHKKKFKQLIGNSKKESVRLLFCKICSILLVIALSLWLCGLANADQFLPELPRGLAVKETYVCMSLAAPANTIFIDVAEYDSEQIIENITAEFQEPITYVSLVIDALGGRPPYEGLPSNETVLQYYMIRFNVSLANKIRNITVDFALEKPTGEIDAIGTKLLFFEVVGRRTEQCPIEKIGEDGSFSYYKTETDGLSYVAVTQTLIPTSWWLIMSIILIAVLIMAIGIFFYFRLRLGKSANLTRMGNT